MEYTGYILYMPYHGIDRLYTVYALPWNRQVIYTVIQYIYNLSATLGMFCHIIWQNISRVAVFS